MKIKVNVKNVLIASALGALVLTGCAHNNTEVGKINNHANNYNDSNYVLMETTSPVDNKNIVDNTIQYGKYYTIEDTTLIDMDRNEVLAVIKKDTYLAILGEDENDYFVRYLDLVGYVPKDAVAIEEYNIYNDNSIKEVKPYTVKHMIRANDNVNIREDMSTDSNILGMIYNGNSVEILDHLDGWYQFEYDGTIAYVKDDYFDEEFVVEGNILKVCYIIEPTELLYEDSNESQRTLDYYETCEVLSEDSEYYLVIVDNVVGRIKKDTCFELEGKTVVVDISSQSLKLYHNNVVLLSTNVVTGKDSTPTDEGLYSIYSKETDRYLVGDGYKSYVNYWMPYNLDEGLHDATWRDTFGGDIYHDNGSHGCVNMDLDDVEVLYNNVEVGTKVLVHK